MTVYSPETRVKINGTTVTSHTLNAVTISRGRSSVFEQARASTASVSMYHVNGETFDWSPGDTLTVEIVKGAGYHTVFSGFIQDIEATAIGYRGYNYTEQYAIEHRISCTGVLARIAMLPCAATYPMAKDGTYIAAILADAIGTSWSEAGPLLTWSAVASSKTWATYDPGVPVSISTPGVYDIHAYTGGIANAWELAGQVATSARGILYEYGGTIYYKTIQDILTDFETNPISLPLGAAVTESVTVTTSLSDVVNQMTVTYKNGQTKTSTNVDSQDTWGIYGGSFETMLENGTDAQEWADQITFSRQDPQPQLTSITIALHNKRIEDSERTALIELQPAKGVLIGNLTAWGYNNAGTIVESFSWQLTQKEAFLTLSVSPYQYYQWVSQWNEVDSAKKWNNLISIYDWYNAGVIV